MHVKNFMEGKTCLVTGGNAGIGYETALGLAKMGAQVGIVCRNATKGEAALHTLIEKSGNKNMTLFIADLSAQKSIRECAQQVGEKYEKLDVLIHNAGIITQHRSETEDGIETQFAVNHLAPFLLTDLLMELVQKSPAARIISVASHAHKTAKVNWDDIEMKQDYNFKRMYSNTKLFNILFVNALARQIKGRNITVNALHPGVITTQLLQSYMGNNRFLKFLGRLMFKSPEQGAETSIYLASSEHIESETGAYFADKKSVTPSRLAMDEALADKLWEMSSAYVK